MKQFIVSIALLVLAAHPAAAVPENGQSPRVFSLSPASLAVAKDRVKAGDPAVTAALANLIAEADRAVRMAPVSVMDKKKTPDSGDKHDYMSVAPYFWPDPTKPDGLPYIRKDGEHNPESTDADASDSPRFGHVCSAVENLGLAYYFTGREEYARYASLLIRTWFLDPSTRMNPNLNFGQAIPGVVSGRGTGIIDGRKLAQVVDAVGVLSASKEWTDADQRGMVDWMDHYLDWLLRSKNGRDEAKASNNHGSFYDVQVVSLALFVGKQDLARKVLEDARKKRIASQIEPDGRLPRELARTKSFSYSLFDLEALEELASLGERAGVDLWSYTTTDGRSLRKALDFLAPYADEKKAWPYPQITKVERSSLLPLLQQGYIHYGDPHYRDDIALFPADPIAASRILLLYAGEPAASH